MNHADIDGKGVVEAYLRHKLSPEDRAEFESHLVDCEDCRDRVLLAEMFHARNGIVRVKPVEPPAPEIPETIEYAPKLPQRAQFVAWLEPWQIWVILIVAAALLVLIPTAGVFFTK